MHYVVVGPGALGCLFLHSLLPGLTEDDSVQLLDHDSRRADLLQQKGIKYTCGEESRLARVEVTAESKSIKNADVVFVCVKSYDLPSCLSRCHSFINELTLVIFLQNGVSHLFDEPEHTGITVLGTTSEGANLKKNGHVVHAGSGLTNLGFAGKYDPEDKNRLGSIIKLLTKGGVETILVENIRDRIWQKLFVNVGINALTAIHNCVNGKLLQQKECRAVMKQAVAEALAVAEKMHIAIYCDPLRLCEQVCVATSENVSSMLQDVRNKRTTEIDSINGAVVGLGQKYGVATPVNEKLVALVKALEDAYIDESTQSQNGVICYPKFQTFE